MISNLLKDKFGSVLLEVVLQELDPENYSKLYASHFKGHLKEIALYSNENDYSSSTISNHVIQKLILYCPSVDILTQQIEELESVFKECITKNRHGIVLSLFNASVRLTEIIKKSGSTKESGISQIQQRLSKSLLQALNITTGRDWKTIISKMISPSGLESEINYLGAMILSAMVKFETYSAAKPIFEG